MLVYLYCKGSDLKETIIVSVILIFISGLFGYLFFQFRKIIDITLDSVKTQIGDVKTEMTRVFMAMGEKTDRLSKNMTELSDTIKENQKQQIENQTDIAAIKSDVKSQEKQITRLEDKVDKHIEGHNKK